MRLFVDQINIILWITLSLNLVLGSLIYLKGRHRRVNLIYSLNVVAIIGWILGMIVYRGASLETSVFWCIILYIAPTFIASSFLYFTYIFPRQVKELELYKKLLIFLGNALIIVLILIPNFIIKDVIVTLGREKVIVFGPGYILYVAYTAFYFFYGFWRLFKKYIKSRGIERGQIIYLSSGYFIAANLAFVTNLFMPWIGRTELNWLGQIFSLSMVGFTAYAIIKYRLMDIRLAVKRSTIFSGIVIIITAVYTLSAFLLGWVFFGGTYTFQAQIITGLIVAFLVAIGFRPLYEWLKKTTDIFLFKGEYRPQELMADISDVLSRTLDLDTVITALRGQIKQALRVGKIEIVILKEDIITGDQIFEQSQKLTGKQAWVRPRSASKIIVAIKGGFKMTLEKKDVLKKLIEHFKKQRDVLILEELKRKQTEKVFDDGIFLIKGLEKIKAALVIPLLVKEKLVGLFFLRAKRSGDMFTNEDIKTLETVAAQAAIALENVRLYEEMKDFSKTLQKEVVRQTKTLKDANIRLKQLDLAKSEFISLASHQLRTPLGIIKGYVSMILEESGDGLTDKQKDRLEKVYASNERLIKLVEDLLTVSRIESGRLELDWGSVSLEEMVEDMIKEFSQMADKKGLYLKYIKPKKALPHIRIDSLKIRQVVQNLIDNALHYTKKGGATLWLEKKKDKVVFGIKDTGIGISDEERVTLFEKFSRGKDVGRMHTEGTGLGLYLSVKLIKIHQGKIWVESKGKNKGSTFYFELPLKKTE